MKKLLIILALLLTSLMLLNGCSGDKDTEVDVTESDSNETIKEAVEAKGDSSAGKTNVVVWYWGGDLPVYADWFNENNPNINIEVVPIPGEEYFQKIATAIATGGDLPDIVAFEASFRQQIINLAGAYEDLEAAPYNLNRDELFDYTLSQIVNDKGVLVSTEMGMTPASLAYKRDMTDEYFGVSTPEELAAMFPTWDSMMAKGRELNASTNGEVFMFADPEDILNIIKLQQDATIVNRAGEIDEAILENILSTMLDAKGNQLYDPQIYTDGTAKNATFAQSNHIFYANPVWAPQYIIKPNDPDSEARWGMMDTPDGNYSMGGCSLGISSSSEVKEEAWAFIKEVFVSEDGAKLLAGTTGALSVWEPVHESEPEVFSAKDDFFAGQDITAKFVEIAREMSIPQQTKYDSSVSAALAFALEVMIYEDADLETMKAEAMAILEQDISLIQ